MSDSKNFLTTTIIITIICGIILSFIGNRTLESIIYKTQNSNKVTCDKDILQKIASKQENQGRDGYILALTGNGITAGALLFMLILSAFFSVIIPNSNKFGDIKNIIVNSLPVFTSLAVITYLIVINWNFKDNIISGHVANEYFSYLSISSILLLLQISILAKYFKSLQKGQRSNMGYLVYVLSFLNMLILMIINIILKFFSTDG